jgi:hypothetical protein
MPGKNTRSYYSESEAARSMGLSVEELRALIRRHIVDSEEDMSNCPKATFYPADLIVLRLLSSKTAAAATNSH